MHKLVMVRATMAVALFASALVWNTGAATSTVYRVAQATTLKQCPKGFYWDRATAMCRRAA